MLDKIESGELSVNQAAIQAGIRKKPTAFEIALKASKKLSRNEIQMLIKELQKHEPRNA
jgi:predicted CopG family antitoxin